VLTSSPRRSTTLPASLRRKKRKWTTEGRVVYERKKHLYTARDATRICLAVLRMPVARAEREKRARGFLESLFRTLLGFLIPHELWPVIGEPLIQIIMTALDWGTTLMKDAAEELRIDPEPLAEAAKDLSDRASGRSH